MKKTLASLFGLGAFLAVLCVCYGFFIEPNTLKVRHVQIVEENWRADSLKIGFVSDLHIGGRHVDPERVRDIVAELNELSPDLILIAGDFVSGHENASERDAAFNREIEDGVMALGALKASLGVYTAIGNHDDWYGAARLRGQFAKANIEVLENQGRTLAHKGLEFCLLGLPDAWTGEPDEQVFNQCANGDAVIALMHSPDSFRYLRFDTSLALAGHTHGGQINLPFVGRRVTATSLGSKYAYGRVDYNGIPGFVTAGVGTSMLPARFRAPPEIVLLELSGVEPSGPASLSP